VIFFVTKNTAKKPLW